MKKGLMAGLVLFLAGTVFASAFSRDYYTMDNLAGIKAELKYEGIVVEGTTEDDVKVEIRCNNHYKMPEISVDDDVLYIRNVKKGTYAENCTIYIYLPDFLVPDYIELSTLSGDIDIKNITVKEIMTSVTSGDIDLEDVEIKGDLVAKAASGDITLKEISADEVRITVASGDIDLKGVSAAQIEAKSASGDIEGEDIDADEIFCSSASGSQELEKVDCGSFELKSASGSITIKLLQEPENDSSINTASGNIDIRLPKKSKFQLEVSSVSGNFEDEFDRDSYRPRSTVISKYNGGGVKISAKTKSGNISLDD